MEKKKSALDGCVLDKKIKKDMAKLSTDTKPTENGKASLSMIIPQIPFNKIIIMHNAICHER